jgi:hypothetical protein
MHELGHILGFRHEHPRVSGTSCTESNWRGVTPYDSLSVMHYMNTNYLSTTCPGSTNTTRYPFLSQRDIDGAQQLYEAPTNVVNTPNQTLYARKASDGRIFKKAVGGGWAVIGAATKALFTFGSDVYQVTLGGQLHKYSGSGTSWTDQNKTGIQQILRCGDFMCITLTDGSVQRLVGSTWATIGGPGSRFSGSTAGLFALNHLGDSVWKYSGSGTSWSQIRNSGYADIAATNASGIFLLTRDRRFLEVLGYNGGTPGTVISSTQGAVRQFHSTGPDLYTLSPDGGTVSKRVSSGMSTIGGAAARLHGSNGMLLATAPNDVDIWRYNGSSWVSEGAP